MIIDINYNVEDILNLYNILNRCLSDLERPIKDSNLNYSFLKIYIPILRGLRPVNFGSNTDIKNINYDNFNFGSYTPPHDVDADVYKFRTLLDYFASEMREDPSFKDTIFTGLNTYQEIRRHMLSGKDEKQELKEEFEEYLSKNFFMNERVKLTPSEDKDVIMVKIGDEGQKPIYDLGDGIQSIIVNTLPLFLIKDEIEDNENALVFIEEPEHLLHPSLQRKLIETFNDERFEKFQFFLQLIQIIS